MKLEKREVTLNEADSLKDMYYMEKILEFSYKEAVKKAERKEVETELSSLFKEVISDGEFLKERLQKSLARFAEIGRNKW